MPKAPPRICPRCQRLIVGRRCTACREPSPSAQVGSTRQQRRLRRIKLENDPLCQWPECNRPASEVDHIKPVAEHPELAFDYDNLQSLCHPHHVEKSNQDRRRRSGKPDDDDEFKATWPG